MVQVSGQQAFLSYSAVAAGFVAQQASLSWLAVAAVLCGQQASVLGLVVAASLALVVQLGPALPVQLGLCGAVVQLGLGWHPVVSVGHLLANNGLLKLGHGSLTLEW